MHQLFFAIYKLNFLTPIITLGLFQVLGCREVEVVTHRACPVALTSHSIAFYSPTTLPNPRLSYLTTPTPQHPHEQPSSAPPYPQSPNSSVLTHGISRCTLHTTHKTYTQNQHTHTYTYTHRIYTE